MRHQWLTKRSLAPAFLPARRYASAVVSYGPVSVMYVCLSVTSRCFIERDERINLVFGRKASFDQSYTAF